MRIRFYEIFLRKQRKRDVTTALTYFSIRARIILEYFNVRYIFPVSYAISWIVSVREMQAIQRAGNVLLVKSNENIIIIIITNRIQTAGRRESCIELILQQIGWDIGPSFFGTNSKQCNLGLSKPPSPSSFCSSLVEICAPRQTKITLKSYSYY